MVLKVFVIDKNPMLLILCISTAVGIQITGAASVSLSFRECKSEAYSYKECSLSKDITILNATVFSKSSDSNCTYYRGSHSDYNGHDGVYGYFGHTLWVDKGCRATFRYYYTDEIWTTPGVSTTIPLTTRHWQSIKTTSIGTSGHGNGNRAQPQNQEEWIEDIPNAAAIAVLAALIIIVTALIITGVTLWKKRFGRFKTFYKHASPAIGRYNTKWENKNSSTFITNRTQIKPSISTVTKPTISAPKTRPTNSVGKTPTVSVEYHKDAKQERYVNYLNVSRPPRPPAGMLKKANQISSQQTGTVKTRLAPIPPKPPRPRNHYENTVTRGDNDEYLVPVSNRGDIKLARTGIENVTRAVENDYQSIEQDHIYATID